MPYTYSDIPEPPSPKKLLLYLLAMIIIIFGLMSLFSCSPNRELHAYRPTNSYAFDSSFRYYRWIGPDERGGKWVRIKDWPKIVKR